MFLAAGPLESAITIKALGVDVPAEKSGFVGYGSHATVMSVISASIIVLVIRTSKPFYRSRPGKYLLISTGCVALAALVLPYTPIAGILGFTPISPLILLAIAGIAVVYIVVTETAKRIFYKKVRNM